MRLTVQENFPTTMCSLHTLLPPPFPLPSPSPFYSGARGFLLQKIIPDSDWVR